MDRHTLGCVACAAAVIGSVACESPVEPADVVLRSGKVVTVDDVVREAEAVAIRGDRITAVGRTAEIDRYIGPQTEVLDLERHLAIPGFIEGPGHFLGIGDSKLQLNLMDVASWDEIVALVEDAVARAQPGELIRGRGWHQDKWDPAPEPSVEGLPLHDALSAISPDNPVILRHASDHATFANARAMAMAGVTSGTPDPPGGEIVRDAAGNPIGAFRETASGLLDRRSHPASSPMSPSSRRTS